MPQTLFLEAFGQLSRDTSLAGIVSEEEDLYSVFNARAELMSWATTASARRRVELWDMNEAELTAGTDASRIGWVQVGLGEVVEPGTLELPTPVRGWTSLPVVRHSAVEPPMVLPALVQCFDDALRRFGAVELSGVQVTANHLDPSTRSCLGDLVGVLNWFNTTQKARADALIAFDQELLGGQTEADDRLYRRDAFQVCRLGLVRLSPIGTFWKGTIFAWNNVGQPFTEMLFFRQTKNRQLRFFRSEHAGR